MPNTPIDPATNRINDPVAYPYDNAGNMTASPGFTYAYDGANRMKQAQQTATPNTTTNSTFFGALRIKKTVGPPAGPPDTTTVYIYSGSKPIAEYVNGSLSKEYIYSGSTLLATIAGGATTYHHPDHLSNRVETDASGLPVRSAGYLPYGGVLYEDGVADKLKFTTYERDSGAGETGLDYAMFRHYSSGLGGFMSADLLAGNPGAPQSLNRYAYAMNDPVNMVDPLGLWSLSWSCTLNITRMSMDGGKTWEVLWETVTGCIFQFRPDLDEGGGGGGSGGGSTNSASICPPIPEKPPTVDISKNIAAAERSKWLVLAVPRLAWFYNKTKSGGPWDYKMQGRTLQDASGANAWGRYVPSPYQDFGNFNFGLTGAAAGIELQLLLRGAGYYQKYVTKNSRPEWGGPFDRKGPFGDDPDDQAQILAGFNFYKYGCYKKR